MAKIESAIAERNTDRTNREREREIESEHSVPKLVNQNIQVAEENKLEDKCMINTVMVRVARGSPIYIHQSLALY